MTHGKWTAAEQKKQTAALESVLKTIKARTARQTSTLAIFDLDGTLFDNRTRTIFILREISEQFDERVPQLASAFDAFRELSIIEYSLDSTLSKLGVTNPVEISFIKQEWAKRFFSDYYQKFDFPMLGAKSYVKKVHEAGATVIYLTGRDVERMLVGTTECLRLYGFPVGIEGTMTIVKREFEQNDEVFKQEVCAYLKRLGEVVAVFENEPANSNILKNLFPKAESFFVMTQHRPDAPKLLSGINRIRDFRLK
jgi:hypothetical protein